MITSFFNSSTNENVKWSESFVILSKNVVTISFSILNYDISLFVSLPLLLVMISYNTSVIVFFYCLSPIVSADRILDPSP